MAEQVKGYPNIERVLDEMPDEYKPLAGMYLGALTSEQIDSIEAAIPEFAEAYTAGDSERVAELAESLGCGELAPQLQAMMVTYGRTESN